MKEGKYQVDLIDRTGNVVDSKKRGDIVKGKDAYHAVYCVLTTPKDELVLNLIAQRQDMPNLHAGKFGCTAATIRRSGETGQQAAERAVSEELKINIVPELLDEKIIDIDGTYRKIGWYKVFGPMPKDYNREDIEELVPVSVENFLKILEETPDKITPPLKKYWELVRN